MKRFRHRFVEFMPERLESDVIYVSTRFSLVSHMCACGCGEEVVTPLSSREWQLIYDGESVSLFPSIGNWKFQCRSHYWIEQDKAVRAFCIQCTDSQDPFNEREIEEQAEPDDWNISDTDRLWKKLKALWMWR